MITLRYYQEESLERIWAYFANGNTGNPLIAYPTGTGKSALPAVFIKRVMQHYPAQRFMMVTHVSTLIEQNAEVLKLAWPMAPLGIYSAGLKEKSCAHPIIFAGIQSAIRNPSIFGFRDIIFIDEAHLISQDESSQYLTFLATMKLINPNLKIIGLTATPFRMGMGMLTDGGLFTDIIHDLTTMDEFNRLIADNYLCPLVPMRTKTELDISNVGMAKNEFIASQLQHAVDKNEVTFAALKEDVELGYNRKSWLIFSSGIEHANHIADILRGFGVECASVHSKQTDEYNNMAISAFKQNKLRAISCFSKLTTGFNHPDIDFIIDLRPTMSIPLHIQKLGRGTRPANGKQNCLVADHSRNVPRLGPVNDPIIPKKKGEKTGDLPVKLCDSCGAYNHISARKCCACGAEFTFQVKIVAKPGTTEILRSDAPVVEIFNVDNVVYAKKENKNGKPPYISVKYTCTMGMQAFNENIFPEHNHAYTKTLFKRWWQQRHETQVPSTTDEALIYIQKSRLPKRIKVWVNRQYPEILSVEF